MNHNTSNTEMNQYLTIIESAVKGKDMRKALLDSITKTYNDTDRYKNTFENEIDKLKAEDISLDEKIADTNSDITNIDERISDFIDTFPHAETVQEAEELYDARGAYDGRVFSKTGIAIRTITQEQGDTIKELSKRLERLIPDAGIPVPYSGYWINTDAETSINSASVWEYDVSQGDFVGQTIILDDTYSPSHALNKRDYYQYVLNYKIKASDTDIHSCVLNIRHPMIPLDYTAIGVINDVIFEGDGDTGSCYNAYREIKLENSVKSGMKFKLTISDAKKITHSNPFSLDNEDLTISDPYMRWDKDNSLIIPVSLMVVYTLNLVHVQVPRDPELVDMRVDYKGDLYDTAGTAVRESIRTAIKENVLDILDMAY